MNKYLNMILCAALALLLVGCVTVKEPAQTTEATLETTEATTAPTEASIPGVEMNPIWDEEQDDNTESNSGNNAENNPGSNNTDKPQETQPDVEQETKPNEEQETQPDEEQNPPAPEATSYESYNAMNGEEQLAFFNTFATPEEFFAWYNQAKAEYEAAHPDIEVGDGKVDMEDIIGGGN